jgi:2'-5' RNA ligase
MDNFFHRVRTRSWPWPDDREDWHWHILPPDEAARLVEGYTSLTTHEGLHQVAPQWLHISLLHSAPVEEVSQSEVDAIIDKVREECAKIKPFELTIGRPSVGTVAIECPAWPGPAPRRLWEIVADASRGVFGDRYPTMPAPGKHYPHASLAYAGEEAAKADRGDLKVKLSDAGDAGNVTFTVEKISLVAQKHDGKFITWRHTVDVPLGGS